MTARSTSAVAALLALAALSPVASAQSTITLWGQTYDVVRFDYAAKVTWPNVAFPMDPNLQLFEAEGVYYAGNNKLYMSADDIADVFIGNPDNFFVEVNVITSGNTVTDIAYSRTLASVDAPIAGYDPNPGGVTVNTGTTGLGAGGNLIICGNDGFLYAYGLQPGNLGQLLGQIDYSAVNFNAEDVTYVPARRNIPAQFFVINQETDGIVDNIGIERRSTSGTLLGTFVVGSNVEPGLTGPPKAVAKGLAYTPDSPMLPASIRRPDGVVFVSFDRDFPAIQVFDTNGNLVGTEYLTTTGTPSGPRRLDITGSTAPMHIESLTVDPATGRIFLVNQGILRRGNWMWVLTPAATTPAGCNRADVTDIGDTGAGPDGQLTVDDIIAYINAFGDSTGCPGTPNVQCNLADVTDIGDTGAGPDGQLTVDDIIAFINAFGDGCP